MLPESTFIPLEFLRPYWLLGILAVLLFSFTAYKRDRKSKSQQLIAPHLTEQLVSASQQQKAVRFAFPLLAIICCLALSGPSYRQIELPVNELEKAQVIALDLSYSMYATDVSPNRLSRAKYKAIDLIQAWSEGEKALIAYAGDAFTISPLTKDGKTIINQIPHLSPDIMPVTGERADLALDKAIALLENAGYNEGHIVFISDDISRQNSRKMIDKLAGTNWVVSVLAVATKQGAPIKLIDGSLLKDAQGSIVVPKLNEQNLYDLSRAGDGLYLHFSNDNKDIEQLAPFFEASKTEDKKEGKTAKNDILIDDGYWLSFLLLPLFLLLFRKGLFYCLLFSLLLPLSSPKVEASIWKNTQQNAYQAYQDKEYQQAAELYNDPLQKGSALYKGKQYEQALEQFTQATEETPDNADAFYNQGNSYAHLGKFDEAINAYQQALTLRPDFKQAAENKGLVKQIKNQQEKQQDNQQDNQQKNKQQSDQDNQQENEQDSQESEQESQQQSDQDSEQENQQQSEQESQESEQESQQQSEQESQESEQESQQQSEQESQESDQQSQQQSEQAQQQEEAEKIALQQTENEEHNQELEELPNWLKNMPDDPSLLLRNKMRLEYRKHAQSRPVRQQKNGDAW